MLDVQSKGLPFLAAQAAIWLQVSSLSSNMQLTVLSAWVSACAGNPSALMAKLSTAVNPHNYAVDWDGIRDSVLDMATYCCSAIASKRCLADFKCKHVVSYFNSTGL